MMRTMSACCLTVYAKSPGLAMVWGTLRVAGCDSGENSQPSVEPCAKWGLKPRVSLAVRPAHAPGADLARHQMTSLKRASKPIAPAALGRRKRASISGGLGAAARRSRPMRGMPYVAAQSAPRNRVTALGAGAARLLQVRAWDRS